MDGVATAQAVLGDLETRHSDAIARRAEIGTRRQQIAFAAHTGDTKAKQALDRLNAQGSTIEQEILGLAAAVTEARSQLEEAQQLAAAAERRAELATVAPITARLRVRGLRLDALATEMKDEAAGTLADMRELHRLGFGRPSDYVVQENLRRAASSAFTRSLLHREGDHVPPSLRHTFADLTAGWGDATDGEVNRALGTEAAAA